MAFKRGPRGGYSPAERASLPDSAFLKPETRSWPVSDERHARIALQYMARGFGNRAEYPMLRKRLFARYPHLEAEMSQRAAANPLARRNWAVVARQLALAALPYLVDGFKQLGDRKLKQYKALVASGDVDGQIAFIRKHAWMSPPVRAALINDEATEWVRVHLNEALSYGAGKATLAVVGKAADLGAAVVSKKAKTAALKNPWRRDPGIYVFTERWGALPPGVDRVAEFQSLLRFYGHPRTSREHAWREAANMALMAARPDMSLIFAVDVNGQEHELRHDQLRQLSHSGVLPAAAKPNQGVSSSVASNVREIERMLKTAPPDWRLQFESGFSKLGRGKGRLTLANALAVLGITAGGNLSSDTASGRNAIPERVREDAMHGLRLSHANDYGAWDFIGIARAIQLATQAGVPDETKRRMRNYFTRHAKDKGSRRFGDDQNPSRGYMAWLNWGGDAGQRWVG